MAPFVNQERVERMEKELSQLFEEYMKQPVRNNSQKNIAHVNVITGKYI